MPCRTGLVEVPTERLVAACQLALARLRRKRYLYALAPVARCWATALAGGGVAVVAIVASVALTVGVNRVDAPPLRRVAQIQGALHTIGAILLLTDAHRTNAGVPIGAHVPVITWLAIGRQIDAPLGRVTVVHCARVVVLAGDGRKDTALARVTGVLGALVAVIAHHLRMHALVVLAQVLGALVRVLALGVRLAATRDGLVLAAQSLVAVVLCAGVVVVAVDREVLADEAGHTVVKRALVRVVAVLVVMAATWYRLMDTTLCGVTGVLCAEVLVVAVHLRVDTPLGRVAGVVGAEVVVIAVGRWVDALVVLAQVLGARVSVLALGVGFAATWDRLELATQLRVAGICGAWVAVVAVDREVLADEASHTVIEGALVRVVAVLVCLARLLATWDGREHAPLGRVA